MDSKSGLDDKDWPGVCRFTIHSRERLIPNQQNDPSPRPYAQRKAPMKGSESGSASQAMAILECHCMLASMRAGTPNQHFQKSKIRNGHAFYAITQKRIHAGFIPAGGCTAGDNMKANSWLGAESFASVACLMAAIRYDSSGTSPFPGRNIIPGGTSIPKDRYDAAAGFKSPFIVRARAKWNSSKLQPHPEIPGMCLKFRMDKLDNTKHV